jgi:glc operon protein GlcG
MVIHACALAVIVTIAILAAPVSLSAQAAAVATLQSVTFSGAAARRAKTTTEINLETAERIVDACIEYARARNSGASVVVLSASGYTVVAKRTDGQTPNNIDSAYQKAKTALYMRASTQDVVNRWGSAEAQLARANLDLYLVVGGLPIIVEDQLIGSIGVGGASADEPCAYEALSKVLGQQPPLPPAGAAAVPASPAR